MRNLTINRIKYTVETDQGRKYGANIPFNSGLNIIYGPNSVGKSSLITGIIYCLGAEKSLGIFQNKQNPFKPEFYERINNQNITKSIVQLEVTNGSKTITLIRSIIKKTDVVGVKETTIDKFDSTKKITYLIASGDGVFSDDGLQRYLFNFLGWDIVEVPTYDTEKSKLYIENLTPLFFVEQRAGWSQIQARQVMRYGIRDIKKVAFEYLMGLDKFEIHIKEIERRELADKINKLRRELTEKETNISVVVNGKIDGEILLVDKFGVGRGSIYDILTLQEKAYEHSAQELENLGSESTNIENEQSNLKDILRTTVHRIRKVSERIELLNSEISSYESYIDRININKQKNKQLKKIENLVPELNISICPICENPLTPSKDETCKLCHHELVRKISTPDENLNFLEDEKTSFEKILMTKKIDLRKEKHKLEELKGKEKTIIENIDHRITTYLGPQIDSLRQKAVELDHLAKDIALFKRMIERWEKLSLIRDQIKDLEEQDAKLKSLIEQYHQSKNDVTILNALVNNFHDNVKQLRFLKDKESIIKDIRIDSNDNYTPYLEAYDLYNISSSSDNVRVIISYYFSMLQTAVQLVANNKIRFPNLLILDEPKQQNLDNVDLTTFINAINDLPKNSCQVILTTFSEVRRDKTLFDKYIVHEMTDEYDYLLKPL